MIESCFLLLIQLIIQLLDNFQVAMDNRVEPVRFKGFSQIAKFPELSFENISRVYL